MPPTAPTEPPGPLPWDQAWQQALYGPHGCYVRDSPATHFATSAQGIPGAGALLAEAVLALARRHGCHRVVDLGCGRGELLAGLRARSPDLRLTGVDVVPRPAGLDVDAWLVSPGGPHLPPGLTDLEDTLVVAHEWLDVVPCSVVARDSSGVWRALTVRVDGTEELSPALSPDERAWAERWLPDHVQRAEIGLARDRALADLAARLRSGVLVAVDYGHTADTRPAHGTLTGFRSGREVAPLPDGSCDLTAHVAVDSAAQVLYAGGRTVRLHRQSRRLPDLLTSDPATPVDHALATTDPTAYLAALARRAAVRTLTAPGGLGDFWWLECEITAGT